MRDEAGAVPEPRLRHYLASLDELRENYPDLPFLGDLRTEMERVKREREAAADD